MTEKLVIAGREEEAVADVVYGGHDVLLAAAAPLGGEHPDVLYAQETGAV